MVRSHARGRADAAGAVLANLLLNEGYKVRLVENRPPLLARLHQELAGGIFVGRRQELGQLKAALEGALSGEGRLVALVGEPGIGKSRTALELATHARLRGAQVLWATDGDECNQLVLDIARKHNVRTYWREKPNVLHDWDFETSSMKVKIRARWKKGVSDWRGDGNGLG